MSDTPRVAFPWIEGRGVDLFWYIGSPLLGLLYVPLIVAGESWLIAADGKPRWALTFGGVSVPLTVAVVVVGSWLILLDGPHFWPTLARTVLDPEEWRRRGGVLGRSFVFFLVGPALVLTPLAIAHVRRDGAGAPSPRLGGSGLVVMAWFVLVWAYIHVVRQHWGFFRLYARRLPEASRTEARLEAWLFGLALYTPPILYLTRPDSLGTGLVPDVGLFAPRFGSVSVAGALHPVALAAFIAAIAGWIALAVARRRRGVTINGSQLALLASVVLVHSVAFGSPALGLCSQALVGVGHNLQYQRIVWRYGRARYAGGAGAAPLARTAFRSVAIYVAAGLVFTVLLVRGPWVVWLVETLGRPLAAWIGAPVPAFGAAVLYSAVSGWLLQHYYLDGKIWKLRKDAQVRQTLGV